VKPEKSNYIYKNRGLKTRIYYMYSKPRSSCSTKEHASIFVM